MNTWTDPDRLLRLDPVGKEIGHNECARCRHDRFVTQARSGTANSVWQCARCGCGEFFVVMDGQPDPGLPPEYLDPVWDERDDPRHWTHYVTQEQAMDWLSLEDGRKAELARAALLRAAIYRRNRG